MSTRPRLTPEIADIRRAVRNALAQIEHEHTHLTKPTAKPLVLVALSGGADSLATAAALAFEAPRNGFQAGAVIVDHGLQEQSAEVAAQAAKQAESLGLDPVRVERVTVGDGGGPEAAARAARYDAFFSVMGETGAIRIVLGHTRDDQAETVLLGLARGSGASSLSGMVPDSGTFVRPLLGITRAQTVKFCHDSGITFWSDPHNDDPQYLRVAVRNTILPQLESELGPGVAANLARTAHLLQEDAQALDHLATELLPDIVEFAEGGLSISVAALENNPAAIRNRLLRFAVQKEFGVSLHHVHTLQALKLVTNWRGQQQIDLPGVTAFRRNGRLFLIANNSASSG